MEICPGNEFHVGLIIFYSFLDSWNGHIKEQLKVQIILTLAAHGYPPATRDEVFKAIFEQAENFKKNQ